MFPQRIATCLHYGIESELSGYPREASALDDSARTAKEAADALGIEVGQIASSLIFLADGEPVVSDDFRTWTLDNFRTLASEPLYRTVLLRTLMDELKHRETRLHDLGDFIRDQRRNARLSLRKLSELAGISNPYLSQIERGLRKPSADVLQQIAKALRSAARARRVNQVDRKSVV